MMIQNNNESTQLTIYSEFSKEVSITEFLQNRIMDNERREGHYHQVVYPTCTTGLIAQSCLFINPIYALGSIPAMIFGLTFMRAAEDANHLKTNAELLLKKSDEVSRFYEVFKEFELNPEDEKIKNLFAQFLKLDDDPDWNIFLDKYKLIEQVDLSLFKSTGNIFLMDAAVTFLREKNQTSQISENWRHLLRLPLSEVETTMEPWRAIEVFNPELDSYRHFFKNRNNLKSIDFANVIVAIFKDIIDKSVKNNII